MNKEKFQIPIPDDEIVEKQINMIVNAGLTDQKSFPTFIVKMYKEIGLRYLFTNIRDGILLSLSAMAVFIYFFITVTDAANVNDREVYAMIFFLSPLLFMLLSLYDLLQKRISETFEVEMVAKYNIFQMAAFRMLNFSIVSIFMNTISIISFLLMYEPLDFFRAFLISTTSLFICSIIFLFSFTKGHTMLSYIKVGAFWGILNILLHELNKQDYMNFLINGSIFIYILVLICSICLYSLYLKKLIRMKPEKGAF